MPDAARPLSVTALTSRIAGALSDLGSVAVSGELSQVKIAPSGHCYATLKDAGAVLSLVMWRSSVVRLPALPREGDKVIAHGSIEVYAPRGGYQLIARSLAPAGQGDLAARFAELKARLLAEGLFAEEHKIALPLLPRAVGLATAVGSAALADLVHSLRTRFPRMPIVHAPCLVQGTGAVPSIIAAIRALDAHKDVDVIIVGRGGGSSEDLWAFNEEAVVRAIAACRTAIVSAVGHETDTTLADFAADQRAKTPTAAGELVVPVEADLRELLSAGTRRLERGMQALLRAARERLHGLARHRALASPGHQIALRRQRLDELSERLLAAARAPVARSGERLAAAAGRLHALSPLAVLARGYAVLSRDGTTLRRSRALQAGDRIVARLADGSIDARVEVVRPD